MGMGYNLYSLTGVVSPTAVIPTFTQTATYTPFDKIKTVTENDKQIVFTYGPDNQRQMAQYYTAGVLTKTRYYIGDGYEKTENADGSTPYICYIYAEGKLVGMYVRNGGALSIKYVRADYQGSIMEILNNAGSIAEERSYDAWGRMRDPDTWDYSTVPAYAYDRGYTGEELLKDFNIINLNGRLYDPLIGRMFSVDPVIGNAANSQSYNSYSYALNNPLKYTDNSGNDPALSMGLGAGFGGYAGYQVGKAKGATGGRMLEYILGGACIGAAAGAGGYYAGGLVSTALGGGAVGGVAGVVAGGFAGGFVNGAGDSWLGGSSFQQGLNAGLDGGVSGIAEAVGYAAAGYGLGSIGTAETAGNEGWEYEGDVEDAGNESYAYETGGSFYGKGAKGNSVLVYDATQIPGKAGTSGTLTWYDIVNGDYIACDSWSALSGSRNAGPIPSGAWELSDFRFRGEDEAQGGYYAHGIGFTVDITPDPQYGRGALRIHPDGNVPGTLGCIGLTGNGADLNQFAGQVKCYLSEYGTMRLFVTGQQAYMGTIIVKP